MRRLAAEGARDLEAAVLIAKARLPAGRQGGFGRRCGAVEERKAVSVQREGIDRDSGEDIACQGAERRRSRSLERAAKRAAGTGSRADLQEYMRKRRSVV